MVLKTVNYMKPPEITPDMLRNFLPAGGLEAMPWMPEFQGLGEPKRQSEAWDDLLEKATSGKPMYGGIGEGLAHLAGAALGGYKKGEADRAGDAAKASNRKAIADWMKSGDPEDMAAISQLSTSDDPEVQRWAETLLRRMPTEIEKKRLGLEEERVGLSREAEDRARDEGVTEALSRSSGQDLQRQQIMNAFNQNIQEMDPERLRQIEEDKARIGAKYNIEPTLEPLTPERFEQERELNRSRFPWVFGTGGVNQSSIQGIGDVPKAGIPGADIGEAMGGGQWLARQANRIGALAGQPAGFEGVRDADTALTAIRSQAQAAVGAIQATGRPSVFHMQMVDAMIPQAGAFVNPDTALQQLTQLKTIVEQELRAEADPRNFPGTAAQMGAKNQARAQLESLKSNLDAIIMKTQQGSADISFPEEKDAEVDDFVNRMLGGQK